MNECKKRLLVGPDTISSNFDLMFEIVFRVPLLVRLTRCRKSRETQQRFQRSIERNHKMTATLLLVTPKMEKYSCKLDGGYPYIKIFVTNLLGKL